MRRLMQGLGFALACSIAPAALAQAWPSKPIKIVVNFPPGGAADQIARSVAPQLQTSLGQNVVVENRAGSGGNLGGDVVAKSPPDGYTLLMSSGGMVSVNPHIYAKMPFDPGAGRKAKLRRKVLQRRVAPVLQDQHGHRQLRLRGVPQ